MNNDLIRREAVYEMLENAQIISDGQYCGYCTVDVTISAIPAVDAVEVVHAKWVDHMVRDWRCSECGEEINKVRKVDGYCYDDKPNYCPNCGAKMDLEG